MLVEEKVRLYCMLLLHAMAVDALVMQGARAGISIHGIILVIILK